MCIFVSARLHATAAPDAPAPIIRTSTGGLIAGVFIAEVLTWSKSNWTNLRRCQSAAAARAGAPAASAIR